MLKDDLIRLELLSLSEEKYQKFASSLIPTCDNLIGVRIPMLRRIAKRIIQDEPLSYLENTSERYFEESMLKALVIGGLNEDIETILIQVAIFIPKINNWSVCDTFCNGLKIARLHKKRVWNFLSSYFSATQPYEIRFLLVMLLFHYIEVEYLNKIFTICNSIRHDDYYVKTAVAWCVSACFIKFPEQTIDYLNENDLPDDTYNKAIQKILDSRRISPKTKTVLKRMKRKIKLKHK